MLNTLITSKTRLRMLIKFFVNEGNKVYLNGLANEFNESTNSLLKSKKNNRVIYNANTSHPMFKILQKIVRQHLGLEQIVHTVIARIGDVEQIALTGEYAKGIDSGNIEIIINGSNVNRDYLKIIKPKIKKKIGREVSFLLNQKIDSNSIILYNKAII